MEQGPSNETPNESQTHNTISLRWNISLLIIETQLNNYI